MAEKREKLFDAFSPVDHETWRAKAEVDLKGADFDKKMIWRTNEGFNVQPLYFDEDIKDFKTIDSLPSEYPYVRGTRTENDWQVRQNIDAADAQAANAKALDVLDKGITSLGFNMHKNVDSLDVLLEGIYTDIAEINFNCCIGKAVDLAKNLVAYLEKKGTTSKFKGSIDFNPYKKVFKKGQPLPENMVTTASELLKIAAPVKGLRVLGVDSVMLCNAGAFIYQELGYALAWGNEWMAQLTEAGFSADEVAGRIKFNMGISTVYFMELAKFRAARMLWAQIAKQYGASDEACKMLVSASTSRFSQTLFDPYVNLLRSQTQAMSAALASVDEIVVTPFDAPYKESDEFSERMARNQQILLKEESHLDKVVDPAGGSYYIEELTMSLANSAWQLFLEVEEKGGFKAESENFGVTNAVNASATARFDKVAKRKEQLLGTNQFPNFTETSDGKECMGGCSCGCGGEANATNPLLNTKRLASGFEELRLATEKAANTPKVFMLTIGNLAMRLARAQFSDNFFGCAGYRLIDNNGFKTVEEGVEAAIKAEADIVVLCSSDAEYPELIPGTLKALNGRAEFVLAGPETDEFKAMGVTNFVNVRTNVLGSLKAFNAKLLK